MGNIIKSFLDITGDTIDKLTSLDVGNLAILLPIENILEDRVSGSSTVLGETDKKEKDYFITAEGKILGSRETNDTAYVYITTETAKKEVEEKIVAQITLQEIRYEGRLDPTINFTDVKWNLLIEHSQTKLLQFKNSPTSEPFNLPYSYFKRFVGVIYGEMGYFVRDINEARAIGCCIINAVREHQRWKTNKNLNNLERFDRFLRPSYTYAPNDSPYKKIMQISLERIVNRTDMNIAFVAALDALIGYNLNEETDYANGGTHWDGGDFCIGLNHDKPKNNGIDVGNGEYLISFVSYWNTKNNKGITRINQHNSRIKKASEDLAKKDTTTEQYVLTLNPNPYPATVANEQRVLYIAVAQHGGTIFWAPNYNEPLNDGYRWRELFVY